MAEGIIHACVFSGGGGGGAYEVGGLKALVDGDSAVEPDIYCGTSVGAFNAAVMAHGADGEAAGSARHLERLWLEEIAQQPGSCDNGVYRLRGDPFRWLDPRCLISRPGQIARDAVADGASLIENTARRLLYLARDDAEPLLERLLEVPDFAAFISTEPFRRLLESNIDLDQLRASPKRLLVVATNWTRGRPVVFHKRDITGEIGSEAIRASAAIPAVFPPVEIDGEEYIDGGVLLNTPLQPVIEAKPEGTRHLIVHVFYLEPRMRDIPLDKVPSTFAVVDRLVSLLLADRMKTHIDTIEKINQLGAEPEASVAHELAALSVGLRHTQVLGECRITVHKYRPRESLGGTLGLLNFKRGEVERLLSLGYEEVRRHDCAADGCLLGESS